MTIIGSDPLKIPVSCCASSTAGMSSGDRSCTLIFFHVKGVGSVIFIQHSISQIMGWVMNARKAPGRRKAAGSTKCWSFDHFR